MKYDINKRMNVTAIFAIAILLPSLTKNQYIQYLTPVLLMLVKDYFLGFHSLMLPIYSCLIFFVILSKYLNNDILTTFTGVFIWHLVINFFVWYIYGGNLINTYIMAIPFDFNLLVSTLIGVVIGRLCLNYFYPYSLYSYRSKH